MEKMTKCRRQCIACMIIVLAASGLFVATGAMSKMFDRLREFWEMQVRRGLVRCTIMDKNKLGENVSVCSFFKFTPELQPIVKECKNDATALFNWIRVNITYSDISTDFWNYPADILATRKGNCGDFAVLLANLLLQSGIPYYKVLICVYGHHVVVEFDGHDLDVTGGGVPSHALLWYCFNAENDYTTREHVGEWTNSSSLFKLGSA